MQDCKRQCTSGAFVSAWNFGNRYSIARSITTRHGRTKVGYRMAKNIPFTPFSHRFHRTTFVFNQ
ncbi:hypothetical protein EYZ11_005438 [Aspergillus tanneri]|uniref:Uncharacterized protein n=1 Tax=Aspergillus tanneri TaxID=1220188 RepID=A0A4S3JII7_9EURO|nr:hypothetical protein EYZ11_005438 [Aspergillus tanneri]